MPFLSINGYDTPVRATGATFSNQAVGGDTRSFGGQLVPDRQTISRQFDIQTPVMTTAKARALTGLIQGDGHKWSFNSDLYSSKGLGPQAGYTVTMSATGGVAGGGYVQVTSAQSIGWRKLQYGDFSVMVYKYTGGAWHQYVYTYDAGTTTVTQYKDGLAHSPVAGDSILNWFSYTSATGDFAFLGKDIDGANGNSRYDELVIVPYLMTLEMVTAFNTYTKTGSKPFGEIPQLNIDGDIIPDGPVVFIGSAASGNFEMASVDASSTFGMGVTFQLFEFQGRSP
jgi:hypothetical protein